VSPQAAARLFALLTGVVVLFQLALAAGAPWGAYAMGGAFPGAYPLQMRAAAVAQAAVLVVLALVILARAGLVLPGWRKASRPAAWVIVALLAVGVILNLITPSPMERLIWAPVAVALFLTSLRVAIGR
jgi:hypothetical protein